MKLSYAYVRPLRWVNLELTAIECIVKFDHLKTEVPFTASKFDVEDHGREIFRRCQEGEFGTVGDFLPQLSDSSNPQLPVNVAWRGWPQVQRFLGEANEEVSRGTYRGIVLVWASMLEEILGNILESFLIDHSDSRVMIWNDVEGPARTFSRRSNLAFALGLITKDELTSCDNIRKIRNAFAHRWEANLSNAEFKKAIAKPLEALYNQYSRETLVFSEDLDLPIKLVYVRACATLTTRLAKRVIEADSEKRKQKI